MTRPDVEGATQYVLERLAHELAPHLLYHSVAHTRDDVVPAAERLAQLSSVGDEASLLLLTAAHYHDLGFVEQRTEHEAIGTRIATETLPCFGYTPSQITTISGLIMATRMPQTPHTLLEQLMSDADLDVLGRADFLSRNKALCQELAAEGQQVTQFQWYQSQLNFVQQHRYWSAAARTLRDVQKQHNVQTLTALLAGMTPTSLSI